MTIVVLGTRPSWRVADVFKMANQILVLLVAAIAAAIIFVVAKLLGRRPAITRLSASWTSTGILLDSPGGEVSLCRLTAADL